jgi:hypothetical protein
MYPDSTHGIPKKPCGVAAPPGTKPCRVFQGSLFLGQFEMKFTPRQVATSLHQSTHCRKDIALLIFGDFAKDVTGLEAYARLTADLIQQTALPTYVIAPPSDPNDLDNPALLRQRSILERREPGFITPNEWEQLIGR